MRLDFLFLSVAPVACGAHATYAPRKPGSLIRPQSIHQDAFNFCKMESCSAPQIDDRGDFEVIKEDRPVRACGLALCDNIAGGFSEGASRYGKNQVVSSVTAATTALLSAVSHAGHRLLHWAALANAAPQSARAGNTRNVRVHAVVLWSVLTALWPLPFAAALPLAPGSFSASTALKMAVGEVLPIDAEASAVAQQRGGSLRGEETQQWESGPVAVYGPTETPHNHKLLELLPVQRKLSTPGTCFQYVRIFGLRGISNGVEFLNLREVEVYSASGEKLIPANATMSSVYSPIDGANKCIDGTSVNLYGESLCHTAGGDPSPWLEIDMGSCIMGGGHIIVYNRVGGCCSGRIVGATLSLNVAPSGGHPVVNFAFSNDSLTYTFQVPFLVSPTAIPTTTPAPTAVPTTIPAPAPTAAPSPPPSPAPSFVPTLFCAAGFFIQEEDGACTKCPVGQFTNHTHAPFPTNCITCAAGTYTKEQGLTSCDTCPTGKLSSPDRSFCEDCSAGRYIKDARECVVCEEGKYAPQPLTGACLPCGAGSFANNATGATTCSPCDAGGYSTGGAFECTPCAAGSYSTSGQSSCVECESGKFATAGQVSCTPCAAGFATEKEGSVVCLACAVGSFQSRAGEASCEPCAVGTFSSESASTACIGCIRGYFSAEGASSCAGQADVGYFIFQGEATECPKHAVCGGGTLLPRPGDGHWVDRSGLKHTNEVYRCPRSTCAPEEEVEGSNGAVSTFRRQRLLLGSAGSDEPLGRDVSTESSLCWEASVYGASDSGASSCDDDALMCMVGAQGPLCGSCCDAFVYSPAERICVACDASLGRLLPALVCLLGLGLLAVALRASGRLREVPMWLKNSHTWGVLQQVDNGALKVAWSNYQIVQSVSWSIDVDFPSPFKEMMSAMSIFSFDFLSLECFFEESDHFTSVFLWSVTPLLLAAALVLHHVARSALKRARNSDGDGTNVTSSAPPSCSTTATLVNRLLLLGYLVLPSVSLKQLQALDCVAVAGGSYLRIDTSIDCNSSAFAAFRIADGLFLLLYLSMPLVWLALLVANRDLLNPPASTGTDAKLALFLRNQAESLEPLRFLFSAYRPPLFYTEVVEMYRRVIFIGILPLTTAKVERRATAGIILSICSLAGYREVQPFLRESTNVLAYAAQYATMLTFLAALAIAVGMDRGMDPLAFGCLLVLTNTAILTLILNASVGRYLQRRRKEKARKNGQAQKFESVAGFSDTKMATTLRVVKNDLLPATMALVFWYSNQQEAQLALLQGLPSLIDVDPVYGEQKDGIVFTLHCPSEVDSADAKLFPVRDAVLCCAVPWSLLESVRTSAQSEDGGSDASCLWRLPGRTLAALRGGGGSLSTVDVRSHLKDPTSWFDGTVLLPPQQIVRAYLLSDKPSPFLQPAGRGHRDSMSSRRISKLHKSVGGTFHGGLNAEGIRSRGSASPFQFRSLWTSTLSTSRATSMLESPSTCAHFTAAMKEIRAACLEQGWAVLYHYTQPHLAEMILATGFRMSTQGQGDGGVYFSTLGPASYSLGREKYEENIIVDCFGVERLEEYRGKHKLDVCLVYGAEPTMLTPAPGGRDNAKMVPKATFKAFALPHNGGNYFLRPDRIVGAFLLDPDDPPLGAVEAMTSLEQERAADQTSKGALAALQWEMGTNGDAARQQHTMLHDSSAERGPMAGEIVGAVHSSSSSSSFGVSRMSSAMPRGVEIEMGLVSESARTFPMEVLDVKGGISFAEEVEEHIEEGTGRPYYVHRRSRQSFWGLEEAQEHASSNAATVGGSGNGSNSGDMFVSRTTLMASSPGGTLDGSAGGDGEFASENPLMRSPGDGARAVGLGNGTRAAAVQGS